MFELSLHILDILENSLRAEATTICIRVEESKADDLLTITIEDNGEGMEHQIARKASEPFTTTKNKQQRVGLGLPLVKQLSEHCNGNFRINTQPGKGTTIEMSFQWSHIDRPPLGSMAETIRTIIAGHSEIELVYEHLINGGSFWFDTKAIRSELEDLPLDHAQVLAWIKDQIEEGLQQIRPEQFFEIPEEEQRMSTRQSATVDDNKVERLIEKYGGKRQNVLAILHELQDITPGNYLKEHDMRQLAEQLGLSFSDLHGVATFYSMFSTEPRGQHIIRVCESGPCTLMGSDSVVQTLQSKLGVDFYETTNDGFFTLEPSSCLGVCGVAPAMMIDDETFGNLSPAKIERVLDQYREEEEVNA